MKSIVNILLSALLLSGCSTSKKVISESVESSRSSITLNESATVNKNDSSHSETNTNDTAVGINEKTVTKSLTGTDLQPAYTADNKKVERQYHFEGTGKDKGIRGSVVVDTSGNITIKCTADSLTLVIQNLKSEKLFLSRKVDSLSRKDRTELKETIIITKTKTVKNNFPGWLIWLALGVGCVAGWFIKKYFS